MSPRYATPPRNGRRGSTLLSAESSRRGAPLSKRSGRGRRRASSVASARAWPGGTGASSTDSQSSRTQDGLRDGIGGTVAGSNVLMIASAMKVAAVTFAVAASHGRGEGGLAGAPLLNLHIAEPDGGVSTQRFDAAQRSASPPLLPGLDSFAVLARRCAGAFAGRWWSWERSRHRKGSSLQTPWQTSPLDCAGLACRTWPRDWAPRVRARAPGH